jgi:hypothetical protein
METRLEFFVPGVEDSDAAEHVWQATQERVGGDDSLREFRVSYIHDGDLWEAEVGKAHRYAHAVGSDQWTQVGTEQTVLVILAGHPFKVCSWDRGVKRGEPILVGENTVNDVIYFAGYGPDD